MGGVSGAGRGLAWLGELSPPVGLGRSRAGRGQAAAVDRAPPGPNWMDSLEDESDSDDDYEPEKNGEEPYDGTQSPAAPLMETRNGGSRSSEVPGWNLIEFLLAKFQSSKRSGVADCYPEFRLGTKFQSSRSSKF